MSILVAIQARMGSTRLPGKILANIGGKPMLQRVWEACWGPFERVVLTSTDPSDDKLCAWLTGMNMQHRRGSLQDVLSRYVKVAAEKRPDVLVRVCADAPFLDRRWIFKAADQVDKTHGPVFVPQALHAGRVADWFDCDDEADAMDREHAGAYWFEEQGATLNLVRDGYITINTPDDLEKARKMWKEKGSN